MSDDGRFKDFINTDSYVYHMEPDQYKLGNILLADGNSLKTTDGFTTDLIVGSALESGYVEGIGTSVRMDSLGFHQLSADQVVIADYKNHCLRLVHRLTQQTSPYAGNCTNYGYADGLNARFRRPAYIIADNFQQEKTLIITDNWNEALREMNTKSRLVITLVQSEINLSYVIGITQLLTTGDIFATIRHGIVKFNYGTKELTKVTGLYTSGFNDGLFSEALFSYPRGLAVLAKNVILVADDNNEVLRLLDFNSQKTSSICSGNRGNINGRFNVCELIEPRSLLALGDTLYCGELRGIRMVRGQ